MALVIYGGLAPGRHRGHQSDIDLAVVLEDASPTSWRRSLRRCALLRGPRGWSLGCLLGGEMPRLAEVYPTKLLDIGEHHRMVCGDDVIASLEIDPRQLRLRVEQ